MARSRSWRGERELPYTKYRYKDGRATSYLSPRAAVVQSVVTTGACQADDAHPGRFQIWLGFSLPSGCYATAAIRQLLVYSTAAG